MKVETGTAPPPAVTRTWLWLLPLAVLLLFVSWHALSSPILVGDSKGLVRNSRAALDCLHGGRFTNCQSAGYRALLQYLPAMALLQAGLSQATTLRVLVALNTVSFVAMFFIAWLVAVRTRKVWAPVLVAALLMSPFPWYAGAAFSEALAAVVVLAAIAVVLLQARPAIVAVLVAFACLGKETNLPFVIALAVICLFATAPTYRRRGAIAIGVGGIAGLIATVGFDYFRYGSLVNKVEYRPMYHVHAPVTVANLFTGLWVAPNSGIVEFWPAALLLIGLTAFAVGAPWRRPGSLGWRSRAGWLVLGLLTLELLGLSTWYAPFGWIAWGSRLILPLFPAMLVVAAIVSGERAAEVLVQALRWGWMWVVAAALAILALPNYTVVWYPHSMSTFFNNDPYCVGAHVETNRQAYYRCISHKMWARSPILWHALGGLSRKGGAFAGALLVASVLGMVALARQMAARDASADVGVEVRVGQP